MAPRSRKRGHRARPPAAPDGAARRRDGAAGAGAPAAGPSGRRRKDDEVRAALRPLAPGERPGAVTVAAIVAVALAGLVIAGYASGARVGGEGSLVSALLLAGVLLVAAWGMWRARYWAVLGFQALLAFQIIIAALSLAVASNLWAAALCLAVIGFGGWLFWKLVRAMARIQMPPRPGDR